MHYTRLANGYWKFVVVEVKIDKKNSSWKQNLTSIGTRLILIESSLGNVPSYMMYVFTMPTSVIKRCTFFPTTRSLILYKNINMRSTGRLEVNHRIGIPNQDNTITQSPCI